jgi:transposase-like protein
MSLRDVEDLLAERGIAVSYETIRSWVTKFGQQYARSIRRDRPKPNDKWHLDEVVIAIKGRKHCLVAQISCNWKRALPETDFRRCVRNAGAQVQSSGLESGRQS